MDLEFEENCLDFIMRILFAALPEFDWWKSWILKNLSKFFLFAYCQTKNVCETFVKCTDDVIKALTINPVYWPN